MATSQMSEVIQYLCGNVLLREGAGLTDGQLLGGYIERRDQAAFATLMRRHGPMVWGVCRRVLPDYRDAEDAFQATFLVLVRKAASIVPRERVANWLYGVAHQTALQARRAAARRRARERQVTEMPEPAAAEQDPWRDLQPLLDQELCRLPDTYRAVLVLCDLEGKTRKETARQLGLPEGTVGSRLARARSMLAKRLARRGLTVSGGALAATLARNTSAAGVPASVMSSTIEAASLFSTGQAATAGVISAKVATLTEGVLKTMLLTKLKIATVVVLMVAAVGGGAGGLVYRAPAGEPVKPSGARASNDDFPIDDLLQQHRARVEIEKQQQIMQSVEEARKSIEKILKDVEEKTGSKQASRETLEEIEKTVKEMLEQAKDKEREEEKQVWNLDFRFKDPRLVTLKIPELGEKAVTVWYLWYQVVNNTDQPHAFIPAFEIVSSEKVYHDEVRARLTEAIRRIEDPANALKIKNSITIAVEPIPPSKGSGKTKGVTGAAVWGYADLDAAKAKTFTVFVSGLSNACSIEGDRVRRKVLKVSFKRRDNEMIQTGPAEWVYRSYKLKLAEGNNENPAIEVEGLIRLLEKRIADLESEGRNWKEERQRLQDQLREFRDTAENPPDDLKEEDRAKVVRTMRKKIRDWESEIASGDRKETSRQAALESYKQRLKELREQLLKMRVGEELLKKGRKPASASGSIVRMDREGTMPYINLGRADGLRPQMTFSIHSVGPDGRLNPMPKGILEVVQVIGDHLSQARITSVKDSKGDPILKGDGLLFTD